MQAQCGSPLKTIEDIFSIIFQIASKIIFLTNLLINQVLLKNVKKQQVAPTFVHLQAQCGSPLNTMKDIFSIIFQIASKIIFLTNLPINQV